MGAEFIEHTIEGKASQSELNAWLSDQQAEDRNYNGHQEGYSGDTQTIHAIELHDKTFTNQSEASDYCDENSKKWEYGVAVYVEPEGKAPYTHIGAICAC